MSLPRGARVLTIVVMRSTPVDPAETDDWNRPIRTVDEDSPDDPPEVLRTTGDLQPRKLRAGSGEAVSSNLAGTAFGAYIGFTDVLDIRTEDILRTLPLPPGDVDAADDGLRYNVVRIDRPGRGRRLDHLEVGCELVTAGTNSTIGVEPVAEGS